MAKTRGPGDHLVFSVSDNIIYRYIVPAGTTPEVPLSTWSEQDFKAFIDGEKAGTGVREGAVPSEARQELSGYNAFWRAGGGTLSPHVVVDFGNIAQYASSPNVTTAYEVIQNLNFRAQIEAALGNPDILVSAERTLLSMLFAEIGAIGGTRLGLRSDTSLQVKVVFADNSYSYFIVMQNKPTATYVPGSSRTKSGQLIPDKVEDLQGTWTGQASGDQMWSWVNHAEQLGATISGVDVNRGTGRIVSIVCAGTGSSKICVVKIH